MVLDQLFQFLSPGGNLFPGFLFQKIIEDFQQQVFVRLLGMLFLLQMFGPTVESII